MNKTTLSLFSCVPATLLFTACLVGPDFEGVEAPTLPTTWQNAVPPATEQADLAKWWKQFGDPQLESILQAGFDNNPNMIQAALAISSAEASLRSTKSGLFPTASASVGGSNSGYFRNSSSSGAWSGGLSASWTPDIWGGTRRSVEAAFATLGSQQAAAAATRTALASSLAIAYFNWISSKEQLRIAKEQLVYQERTYKIVKQRVATGFESNLDLQESRQTIASTRSNIPSLEANIATYENAIALYLGTTLDQIKLSMPSPATFNKVPRVPTNLPSDLLRRRPDIIVAEYSLHASSARIGVAVANLFPSISLTGYGSASSSSDFSHYFSSSTWGLSASASQSIFNRVALKESVNIAELTHQSEAQSYRETVLSAFSEVEDELITYARLTEQLPEYENIVDASKKAAELSLRLYNEGQTDFINVASAERTWLSSELTVIQTRQQVRMSLARLCTAMGGGYEVLPPKS